MANRKSNVATKTATRERARVGNDVLASIDDVVRMARTVTPENFAVMVGRSTANHGIIHAARHIARFTGHRVMQTQNATLAANAEWQLDDVQLLFVWRTLFPMSSGKLFTGSIADGVGIVRGVRADYNRTGHGLPSGKPAVESVAYGAKRFAFAPTGKPAADTPVPANPVIVEPKKKNARGKRAAA